jgi:hypothetical protein
MKVVNKKLTFTPSASTDVVKHTLYICPSTEVLDETKPSVDIPMPQAEYVLPGVFDFLAAGEGTYKIGLSATDDQGNVSDIYEVEKELDFFAPFSPTNVEVVPV